MLLLVLNKLELILQAVRTTQDSNPLQFPFIIITYCRVIWVPSPCSVYLCMYLFIYILIVDAENF